MTEVVAALFRRGRRILICQRPAEKFCGLLWEFAGGKVEPGETAEQALRRECREELDIGIAVGKPYMDVRYDYPDRTVHMVLLEAEIIEGVPRLLEHNDMRWAAPEELGQYSFCPADAPIVRRLQEENIHVSCGDA